MKVTPALAVALTNLRGNRDFEAVLGGLKEYEAELTIRCVDGSGETQLRAAGGVKALQAVRKAFDDAPATLNKMKIQSQQGK